MNVLVTGANSQLGKTLFDKLKDIEAEEGDNIYRFTSLNPADGMDKLDITDAEAVNDYILKNHINVVLNFAAFTDVNKGSKDPESLCMKVNAIGPKNLAEACNKNGAVLIHISTDFVFNGQSFKPYEEERYPVPVNNYGYSKLEGEKNIVSSGCHYLIFRIQGLYSKYRNNFVTTMIQSAKYEKNAYVFQDRITSLTNAEDFVDALFYIIESNGEYQTLSKTGIYHYSDWGCASWYDIAKFIYRKVGTEFAGVFPRDSHDDEHLGAPRPFYSVLDKNKFKTTFPFVPMTDWADNLSKFIAEYE